MSGRVTFQKPAEATWAGIRTAMKNAYGQWYKDHELAQMELKWRRIFAECGWDVKERPKPKPVAEEKGE